MRIDSRDLLGLPVVTASGTRLGKVLSFEVDADSHAVVAYHVGARNWPLGGTDHLIAPGQVLAITAEKMTVADGAVRETDEKTSGARQPMPTAAPVATRNAE